jgi:hypothetical protein
MSLIIWVVLAIIGIATVATAFPQGGMVLLAIALIYGLLEGLWSSEQR